MKKQIRQNVFLNYICCISFIIIMLYNINLQLLDKDTSTPEVAEQKSVIDEPVYDIQITQPESIRTKEKQLPASLEEKEIEEVKSEKEDIFKIGYTTTTVNVRRKPSLKSKIIDIFYINTEIEYISEKEKWVKIKYKNKYAYIYKDYVSEEITTITTTIEEEKESGKNYNCNYNNSSEKLTPLKGVNYGPSGKETYYNLNMSGIIQIMRRMGNNDPYWVREDGCKMLGNYIMVAADLNIRPRGSIVETSLGLGIVCDTGSFIYSNPYQLDIAVTW